MEAKLLTLDVTVITGAVLFTGVLACWVIHIWKKRRRPERTPENRSPGRVTVDDDADNRSVRVFVSSTFLDMQEERRILVNQVFEPLRSKYRARGVELFAVDLRWGITREMQERGALLPTLLSEIDRCRPYFIGLLGDRYGWAPSRAALTTKLKADYPVLRAADGASITAIEIRHGVLRQPNDTSGALFFERAPGWNWRARLDVADQRAARPESAASRRKLSTLKAQVRRAFDVTTYSRPEDLQSLATEALDALLDARFPESDTPDEFDKTSLLHSAYARVRRRLYIGGEPYLRALDQWISSANAAPLLIAGASGGGKSALIANWVYDRKTSHPSDVIFEHYLGASPDSAEPSLIMSRLWEHLNRETGERVDPPALSAGLMDFSAALVGRTAQARSTLARDGRRIIIVLDGLDKLTGEQTFRWLPMAPGVAYLVSSLAGEAERAALAKGFSRLEVTPLAENEAQKLVREVLTLWRRSLEPDLISRILQPAARDLAGSPLFLITVLDELRVSADLAHLVDRLEFYRNARDMPDLFDRVLQRLEEDCEPGLVAKALPLIWASRFGLEETEIINLTGATTLAWSVLRYGLSDGLRDQTGRIVFGHDFIRQAVADRYLQTDDRKRTAHLAVAARFKARAPDLRQMEELPFQFRAASDWDQLIGVLTDLDHLALLRHRGDVELLGFWLPLKAQGHDPEALLCNTFEKKAGRTVDWSAQDVTLAATLTRFLEFIGARSAANTQIIAWRVQACERLLGSDHLETLATQTDLAKALRNRGELDDARRLQESVLQAQIRLLGPTDRDTLSSINELALTLNARGDDAGARLYQEPLVATLNQSKGPADPLTLSAENNLANTLRHLGEFHLARQILERILDVLKGRFGPEDLSALTALSNLAGAMEELGEFETAQTLHVQVLEARTRILGSEHPDTLTGMNNLAAVLLARGLLVESQQLNAQVLEARNRLFGPDHRETLIALNNLAATLKAASDLAGAQSLQERALEGFRRTLGPDHPDTLSAMNNLAQTDLDLGDGKRAEDLQQEAWEGRARILGPEHPSTLNTLSSLAEMLRRRGDLERARDYQGRAMEALKRILGPEHPDTLNAISGFALVLVNLNNLEGAQTLQETVLEASSRRFGAEHPLTINAMTQLANTLKMRGDLFNARDYLFRARDYLETALAAQTRRLGAEHLKTLGTMNNLAATLSALGEFAAAGPYYEKVLEARKRILGPEHPETLISMINLAAHLHHLGNSEGALDLFEAAHAISLKRLGPDDTITQHAAGAIATLRALLGI